MRFAKCINRTARVERQGRRVSGLNSWSPEQRRAYDLATVKKWLGDFFTASSKPVNPNARRFQTARRSDRAVRCRREAIGVLQAIRKQSCGWRNCDGTCLDKGIWPWATDDRTRLSS